MFRTVEKSSRFFALFSRGRTTEIPSNEKTAVPKNKKYKTYKINKKQHLINEDGWYHR